MLDMSAFKISQFPDDFALALVEFQEVIRVLLCPFVVPDRLWCEKRLHFLVEFAQFPIQLLPLSYKSGNLTCEALVLAAALVPAMYITLRAGHYSTLQPACPYLVSPLG